jgi:hypothetical protein
MEPTNQVPQTPTEPQGPIIQTNNTKPRRGGRTKMFLLLVLLLLVAAAAGGYMVRDKTAKSDAKTKQDQITALQQQQALLNSQLAAAKAANTPTTTAKAPSAATLDNIKAAVISKNYAALEGYMAPTVKVVVAASEGLGNRTPTQAVADLKYLDSGTSPWDFALASATLSKWQAGTYKQYFPTTALAGKSANNYVTSFQFDENAKISGVFMAASSDML